MIELPEAVVISRQASETLAGKRIASVVHNDWPLKWAFYNRPSEEYVELLTGRTLGEARPHGSHAVLPVGEGYHLILGGGGERILYHTAEKTIPKTHQLLLRFEDDTLLTVSVQGWGAVFLMTEDEMAAHPHLRYGQVSPLSEAFTLDHLRGLFATIEPDKKTAVKYLMISEPGILGVGNGYLQDILFRARIHPRRRCTEVTDAEQAALHAAIGETLTQAIAAGGRTDERDLYNARGGYERLMSTRTQGTPCPVCGTTIEKGTFLGGAIYFCPQCQLL